MTEHRSLSLDRCLMGGNADSNSGDGESVGANGKFHSGSLSGKIRKAINVCLQFLDLPGNIMKIHSKDNVFSIINFILT
jgi:hypothetical protein